MHTSWTTFAVALVLCVGSVAAQGQDRQQVPPADKVREAIERLEARIKQLEKELQKTRKELADLKNANPGDQLPNSRPIPYMRFPIDVERAMMGEGMQRALRRGGTMRQETNRRTEFNLQRRPER